MSKILKVLISIYALLYVLFMVSEQYGDAEYEPLVVKILFAIFLMGYLITWKSEIYGGLIFVLWWIGMWYLGIFIVEQDKGAGVAMGTPLFILAILLIVSGYKSRKSKQ